MKKSESKLSLVGWGDHQAVLHINCRVLGVSFWKDRQLQSFSVVPWLRGHLAVLNAPRGVQHERRYPDERVIRHMRTEAMKAAYEAVLNEDIYMLSEAIITTYMAQQMMGRALLPHMNEIGKRYAGNERFSVYLFAQPERVTKLKQTQSVLAA
jgi:hypothetical protein